MARHAGRLTGSAAALCLLVCMHATATPDPAAVRLAIDDLTQSFPEQYTRGAEYLARLDAIAPGDETALEQLAREALLANPLLDFGRLLFIKRKADKLGLPQNWESNSSLPMSGFDNAIMTLSPAALDDPPATVYRPDADVFVGDVDLDFDGRRILFSMPGDNGRWQLFEMQTDGAGLTQLPLIHAPDIDNYDACYLPNGDIVFCSTAPFVGVPCVTGSSHVCNLYYFTRDTGGIRRLTFEQDHNWCPTVLPNGRVLYLRWEYSDIPHFVSRILFHMNPDGTGQMEYYGSNSYWPNALFYARPLPGSSTSFVAIVGGHHGVPRMGELVVFDTERGRHEAAGVVQRIPGRGEPVAPIIRDNLVDDSWPKFLHPYPLSDKYFLVSAKPTPESLWGIYLVDVFDNMTLLREERGYALLEPIPVQPIPRPPVIPAKVDPKAEEATMYVADVYVGPGLEGVKRGTVTALRLFTYHFAYHGMGGQINRVGLDGPWDIKRVLGTVPVEPDGSALFTVPANMPISMQPLDEDGQALQLMRSWATAMPGEVLSCVGCHEQQSTTPPSRSTRAAQRAPSEITPWHGPARGFSFQREVQPVLDRNCVSCHRDAPDAPAPCLVDAEPVHPPAPEGAYRNGTRFSPAYLALRRYVRTHTIESDLHVLAPYEFHASTTRLVRMLRDGHKDVTLSVEDWDRLITWIDLGAPAHGTWHENVGMDKVAHQRDRRMATMAQHAAGRDEDPEAIANAYVAREAKTNKATGGNFFLGKKKFPPDPLQEKPLWERTPGTASETGQVVAEKRTIMLRDGIEMVFVPIPPGTVQTGGKTVSAAAPFWMSATEVTNAQYACFDPQHDSRLEHGDFLQFSVEERGYPLNAPDQPVVRVTQQEARAFCAWLTTQHDAAFALPTETQWVYARAAFNACPEPAENLADSSLYTVDSFDPWRLPHGAIHPWRPADKNTDDGYRVSAPVASFPPNARGLHDMVGNVSEWVAADLEEETAIACGGSWYDRRCEAGPDARKHYKPWQPVFDVGFRVVLAAVPGAAKVEQTKGLSSRVREQGLSLSLLANPASTFEGDMP
ncbi:MAG: SUMF1/EgtB/PvdO family nonheme iron enzyme [Candidatus Hydrogenedentota bacterium]